MSVKANDTRPDPVPQGEVERLVKALAKVMPIRVENGQDYAEIFFADGATHSTHAMTVNPADWQEIADAFAAITPTSKREPSDG